MDQTFYDLLSCVVLIKVVGLKNVEVDKENLLSVFGWAKDWVGVGGVTFTDTAVHEKYVKGAQLRKTKQGVCWRSRKCRRRS